MAASQADMAVLRWWWWHQQWRSKWIHQSMTKHTNSYENNNIASPLTGCTVVFNNSSRSMFVLISPFPVGSSAYTRTHRRRFGVILFNEKEEQIRQTMSPPQTPLCFVRGLGRGKKKARVGRWEGKERRRDSRLFPLPIFPYAFVIFRSLPFLLGYPVEASLCGGERDKLDCGFG